MPECSVGVNLLALVDGVFYWHVRERSVHAADDHVCFSGHAGMYGAFGELEAENGVGALGRDAPHHVARVKVLDVDFSADLVEMFLDFAREEFADIVFQNVSAGVAAFFLVLEEFLSGAFGNGNHGMCLAAGVAAFERLEEPAFAFEFKRNFGHEAEVHDRCRERCVRGDKSGIAAHELHEAKSVVGAVGFDVRARDDVCRTEHGCFETECAVDEVQVVVDGFRDADDGNGLLAFLDFFGNGVGSTEGAVTADAEQHVDVEAHERIDHDRGVLQSAGAAEDCSAVFLDGIDDIWVQHDGGISVVRVQTAVAVGDTEDVFYAVVEPEHLYKALDDVVEAGAESAASYDACAGPGRVVENDFARARRFEGRNRDAFGDVFRNEVDVGCEANLVVFGNERDSVHRGLESSLADGFDRKIIIQWISDDIVLGHTTPL